MSHHEEHEEHGRLPALGQPPGDGDTPPDPDFAREHDATAVDRNVLTGEDADEREEEAPRGWSGEES